jgi:malate dehydrogenase (oxaloacetate-decarboxylating)(NADP+)
METGVARKPIADLDAYRDQLESRFGHAKEVMRVFIHKAQKSPKRIVFPEGNQEKILRAAQIILDEEIATPILLGNKTRIEEQAKALDLDLTGADIVDPIGAEKADAYAGKYYDLRKRKGVTRIDALSNVQASFNFGMMMVNEGDADGLVAGLTQHYPGTIRPALQIIKARPGITTVAGMYMMIFKKDVRFIADATVNFDPTADQLADIAILAAEKVRSYDIEPRIAMLSFSNFGSTVHPSAQKMAHAVDLVKSRKPDVLIDGEMMADTAVSPEILQSLYPFSPLKDGANVLICPNLESANIAYKLLANLGGAEKVGPILLGIRKPVYLLIPGNEVTDIVNVTAMAVWDAQEDKK